MVGRGLRVVGRASRVVGRASRVGRVSRAKDLTLERNLPAYHLRACRLRCMNVPRHCACWRRYARDALDERGVAVPLSVTAVQKLDLPVRPRSPQRRVALPSRRRVLILSSQPHPSDISQSHTCAPRGHSRTTCRPEILNPTSQ